MNPVSIAQQIEAVEREIGMRNRVYRRWIRDGKMSQTKADHELNAMRAALATLRAVAAVLPHLQAGWDEHDDPADIAAADAACDALIEAAHTPRVQPEPLSEEQVRLL